MSELITFSGNGSQNFLKALGKFASFSGVNKYYHLLIAIEIGKNEIGEVRLIEYINDDLARMKEFEVKTGCKTIYSQVKSWNNIFDEIAKIRPILQGIEYNYDLIYKKRDFEGKEMDKVRYYRQMVQKISPYNVVLHYLFNVILKMSNMQQRSVPNEYLKSAETIEYQKDPFAKPRTETQIPSESNA